MIEQLPNLLKNSHFFCTPFETFWVVFLLPKMGRPGSFSGTRWSRNLRTKKRAARLDLCAGAELEVHCNTHSFVGKLIGVWQK